MRVKICGIKNLDDALFCINSGADAIGFVFYEKSIRYIDVDSAKSIVKELPPFCKTYALFVNKSANFINDVMRHTNIDLAQIHFTPKDTYFYEKLQTPHLKVVRAECEDDISSLKKDEYFLIDYFSTSYGGSAKRLSLDWFDKIDCSNLILAGGLDSENISELKRYNFFGVDVSSGVESSRGVKSKQKIKLFIKRAKDIDSI